MKSLYRYAGAALLVIGCLGGVPLAQAASVEETIAARQANFKRMDDLMDQIKAVIASGRPASEASEAAKEVAERGRRIAGYFPDGTQSGGKTKARAEIWSNPAGFETAATGFVTQADRLASLAGGSQTALADQFKQTAAACGACHRNFRAR